MRKMSDFDGMIDNLEEVGIIANINSGVCHRRIQTGEPSFFVNWTISGRNKYRFFSQMVVAHGFESKLKQR